jgi:hypothetical protein
MSIDQSTKNRNNHRLNIFSGDEEPNSKGSYETEQLYVMRELRTEEESFVVVVVIINKKSSILDPPAVPNRIISCRKVATETDTPVPRPIFTVGLAFNQRQAGCFNVNRCDNRCIGHPRPASVVSGTARIVA